MKFKIGDEIIGRPYSPYSYTTDKAIMKVVEYVFGDSADIKVEILSHEVYPNQIGNRYPVNSEDFVLSNCCPTCHQALPEKPIKIGSNNVEFTDTGIKVGCTSVDKETVLKIAAKLQEAK